MLSLHTCNFSIRILPTSCPWALLGSQLFYYLAISALVTRIYESVMVVFILIVAVISFALSIRGHCLANLLFNSRALSLKFEASRKF